MKRKILISFTMLFFAFLSCQKGMDTQQENTDYTAKLNPQAESFYSTLSQIIKATTIPGMMTKAAPERFTCTSLVWWCADM